MEAHVSSIDTAPSHRSSAVVDSSGLYLILRTLNNYFKDSIVGNWRTMFQEPLQPGYRRIEWTCVSLLISHRLQLQLTSIQECGEQLYGDFANSEPEGVTALLSALHRPMEQTQSPRSSTNTSMASVTMPESAHLSHSSNLRSTSKAVEGDVASLVDISGSEMSGKASKVASARKRYFELCINHSGLEKRLHEIDISNVTSDGELFCKIKEQYLRLRGSLHQSFYLRKPVDIHYVRVSILRSFSSFTG